MAFIVGIDPGPMVGIVGIEVDRSVRSGPMIVQCSPGLVDDVLNALAEGDDVVVAVERFVVGQRSARSNDPGAGRIAREVVEACRAWADERGIRFVERSAAEVKPWATDARLAAAGLLGVTAGMRHARDAARQALFCAVRDCGLRDPLSRAGGGDG